ncbi:hypothetical protein F511_32341 [Dorcoceras hygrometricum]|uniref:Uncharacterized protein n=1 Tax=Dorcoceras hygrometricum TaxID=472368 RepID=A0A2Z7D7J7_9LAMI|nr:hypothetical protein F511_32341 [Dorcoceras hygrometricum]
MSPICGPYAPMLGQPHAQPPPSSSPTLVGRWWSDDPTSAGHPRGIVVFSPSFEPLCTREPRECFVSSESAYFSPSLVHMGDDEFIELLMIASVCTCLVKGHFRPVKWSGYHRTQRKLGARRRSDTVLVSSINDADHGSADVTFRTPPTPYEKSKSLGSGGSMVARLKIKGIDGRAPPGTQEKKKQAKYRDSTSRELQCIQSQDVVPVASKLQRYESSRSDKPAAKQLTIYESWMSTAELNSNGENDKKPAKEKDTISHTVEAGVHLWSLGVLTAAGWGVGSVHEL